MQLNWQASLNLTFNVKQNRLTSLYVTMFNTFPVRLSANHKAQPKSMTHNLQQVKKPQPDGSLFKTDKKRTSPAKPFR
jgi:hypothetical protein